MAVGRNVQCGHGWDDMAGMSGWVWTGASCGSVTCGYSEAASNLSLFFLSFLSRDQISHTSECTVMWGEWGEWGEWEGEWEGGDEWSEWGE